jgi:hypothetical protein
MLDPYAKMEQCQQTELCERGPCTGTSIRKPIETALRCWPWRRWLSNLYKCSDHQRECLWALLCTLTDGMTFYCCWSLQPAGCADNGGVSVYRDRGYSTQDSAKLESIFGTSGSGDVALTHCIAHYTCVHTEPSVATKADTRQETTPGQLLINWSIPLRVAQ